MALSNTDSHALAKLLLIQTHFRHIKQLGVEHQAVVNIQSLKSNRVVMLEMLTAC